MRQSLEENLMAFFREHESESFSVQEISEHFGFTGSKDFKILVKQLADLEDSGKIVLTRQGKFGFNQKNRTLQDKLKGQEAERWNLRNNSSALKTDK